MPSFQKTDLNVSLGMKIMKNGMIKNVIIYAKVPSLGRGGKCRVVPMSKGRRGLSSNTKHYFH
jgi:hypothetical protein